MIKSLFFRTWLVLAAVLLPANLSAQEIMEPVDSVWADTVAVADNDVDEIIEIEAIGMHFDKEYPDEANKITHVSVIHREEKI